MKKIVFILSSLQAPRPFRRIAEFRSRGYDCDVYGFSRNEGKLPNEVFEKLGDLTNGCGYFKRFLILISSILKLKKKYRHSDCVFYCFAFDVTLIAWLLGCRPYIYECSDLEYSQFKFKLLIRFFAWLDRQIIKSSIHTVFTSAGFFNFFSEKKIPSEKISVITNRLNRSILALENTNLPQKDFDESNIVIGFTGGFRFSSLFLFAEVIAESFPNITLNVHGRGLKTTGDFGRRFEKLKEADNVHFFPEFKNPDDLPSIYSNVDLILCTYGSNSLNVRVAEPNKLYEAMFFRRPILVSEGTYLSERVENLGIGFSVDTTNKESIKAFLGSLNSVQVEEKKKSLARIPLEECINVNDAFFEKLRSVLQ